MVKFVQKLKNKKAVSSALCGGIALVLGYVSYNLDPVFVERSVDLIYKILENSVTVPYIYE